jgi:hypothetical protein
MDLDVKRTEVSQSEGQISHRFGDFVGLPSPASNTDILVEVTYKLGAARSAAQGLLDRELLYFIDMAIFQACERVSSVRDPTDSQGQPA